MLRIIMLALALGLAGPALAQDQPAAESPAAPPPGAPKAAGETGEGNVIWRDRRCAFFIVQSTWGYSLFEYLNGPWPEERDVIAGKLDGFGTRNLTNKTADNQLTLAYSEVSSTSKKWVGGKIPGFCRRKKDFLTQLEAEGSGQRPSQAPAAPGEIPPQQEGTK